VNSLEARCCSCVLPFLRARYKMAAPKICRECFSM
jgi:hypothetical protein